MTALRLLAAAAVAAALASPADAALIITIENKTIPAPGTGTLDVFVRSDTGADLLDSFGVEFLITSANGRRLQFLNPQTDPQRANAQYIFFGNSGNPGPLANISTTNYPNDTYIGGDFTSTAAGVLVPTTDRLLARLQLVPSALLGLAPEQGNTFTVSLRPTANTFFFDPDFVAIDFASTSCVVTIGPATPVDPGGTRIPEPTSLLVLATCGLVTLVGRGFRRRAVWRHPAE